MSYRVIGTCGLCGGPVRIPELWGGSVPPVPSCADCGAKKANAYGPVLPMVPDKPYQWVNGVKVYRSYSDYCMD